MPTFRDLQSIDGEITVFIEDDLLQRRIDSTCFRFGVKTRCLIVGVFHSSMTPFCRGKNSLQQFVKEPKRTNIATQLLWWSSFAACLLKPVDCSKWGRGVNLIGSAG